MTQQLLRRAWDFIDTVKQVYPEDWSPEDQVLLDDLMKADLDLSGVKREWVGLTQKELDDLWDEHHDAYGYQLSADGYERAIEAKLKEKNT